MGLLHIGHGVAPHYAHESNHRPIFIYIHTHTHREREKATTDLYSYTHTHTHACIYARANTHTQNTHTQNTLTHKTHTHITHTLAHSLTHSHTDQKEAIESKYCTAIPRRRRMLRTENVRKDTPMMQMSPEQATAIQLAWAFCGKAMI